MREANNRSKFVPQRVPLFPDEPTTLVEIYQRVLRDHPKQDTLNYKRDGKWHSISAEEMLAHDRRIALGLYSLGIRRGDRIAIFSESRFEWVLADQGSIFAGAIPVPIYPTLTPPQVAYILKDSGARALFTSDPTKFEAIASAVEACPSIENIIVFESDEALQPKLLTLNQLQERGDEVAKQQPQLFAELVAACQPDDLATIIYTSGTTGEPKGVMLTHANMVSNLIDSSNHLEFGEKDSALSVLPLSHGFERGAMNMYLNHGMSVYIGESLDKIGVNLREVHPTIVVGVPRVFEKILARVEDRAASKGKLNGAIVAWAIDVAKQCAQTASDGRPIPFLLSLKQKIADLVAFKKWREAMGGRIRIFVSGGAALANDTALAFAGAGMPIVQGYGLTETSPVITAGQLHDNRIGTAGKPIRNVEVRIAEDGEIETRGPHIMRGYWNKPEETRALITEDGWFKTGDVGHFDKDGYLIITDRKKELLKTSGGKYIAPQPIEQLIKSSRFVNQAVVIGNGRKFPSVLIVPNWEQLQSYARLKGLKLSSREEFCSNARIIDLFERQIAARTEDLAQFEKIKRVALLSHELTLQTGEMTPTLKVKRRVVDEKYRELIDEMYREAEADYTR